MLNLWRYTFRKDSPLKVKDYTSNSALFDIWNEACQFILHNSSPPFPKAPACGRSAVDEIIVLNLKGQNDELFWLPVIWLLPAAALKAERQVAELRCHLLEVISHDISYNIQSPDRVKILSEGNQNSNQMKAS